MTFTGNVLEIDLNELKYEVYEVETEKYEKWLGTTGIAYEMAEKLSGKFDPLSEDNFIIFSSGVLANTKVPGAVKTVAITKNPLNRTYGPSVVGGRLAMDIKRAGYDFLIVKGKSDQPLWIDIYNDEINFMKADFWGRDAIETYELLKDRNKSVITIGQAGENLVRYAISLVDGMHHLGKAGLGAVMGSKKLKAIRIGGNRNSIAKDNAEFEKNIKDFRKRIQENKVAKLYAEMGIMVAWNNWAKHGYLARDMKSHAVDEGIAKEFGVEKYLEKIKVKSAGCHGCPTPCKAIIRAELNGSEILSSASLYLGVAYEFGVKCGVENAESAVLCHDIANRYGIDAMLFSELFDILVTLKEKNQIDIDIKRDSKSVLDLMKKVVERDGIGMALSKGVDGLKEMAEFDNYFIKGVEPLFDPRVSSGSESFGLLTNLRGAQEGPVTITVLPGRRKDSIEQYMRKIGANEKLAEETFKNGLNPALYTLAAENWLWVLNGLGICRRESIANSLDIDLATKLFVSATGIESSPDEMFETGGRAFSLARSLNCTEGYTMKDDLPPKKFFEPLDTWEGKKIWRDYLSGKPYSYQEVVEMLKEYYRFRGWKENGCP